MQGEDRRVDACEVAEAIAGVICGDYEVEDTALAGGLRVRSFEDAGVLTRNRGFVVSLSDGSEFQVIVVRSK